MKSGLTWICPKDPASIVTPVGRSRISGAETVCGANLVNETLDLYFVDAGGAPTVGGSSLDVRQLQKHSDETPQNKATPHKLPFSATIRLVDQTTITFVSIDDSGFGDLIPVGS